MNDLQRNLGAALGYLALGMPEEAWDELESLPPELRAEDLVLDIRISIYHRLEKWEDARVLAESLTKSCPENPQWWILWAYSLRREKSVDDARAVLMNATIKHPDVAIIRCNLACYSCMEGDLETASYLLKQAFAMDPDLKKIALDDSDLAPFFGEVPSASSASGLLQKPSDIDQR